MALANGKSTKKIFQKIKHICLRNKLVIFFFFSHTAFAIFLGQMFAFAPDEQGYLFTFNNVYKLPVSTDAQSGSGWITAPTFFLWIAYLPAKVLNLVGVQDLLSIRILSIAITTFSLYLLLKMKRDNKPLVRIPQQLIYLSFFIPSVFLWTSIGLREAFIIFAITLFLVGLNCLFLKKTKLGLFFLFTGSYGLLSTKPYLWFVLMIAVIIFLVLNLILKTHKEYLIKLIAAGFMAPLILFAGTTSQFALNYFFSASLNEAGLRCGDSLTKVDGATFNGDSVLISLHFYFLENQNSAFTKLSKVLNLESKVESLWIEKLRAEVNVKNELGCQDTTSLNSSTLKPGSITEPWTMLWPAFVFLMGPFPFVGEPGFATKISSFESPLWWLLYTLVIYQFYRFRKSKLFRDPAILLTLIFLAGEIAFSSLVEVNLGTSFRHRSILLVPLVFLYVRIIQRVHELRESESKPIL